MGIKDLNKFLRKYCNETAIYCMQMKELSGKKIAVDISIYMYKYAGDNTLIENIYLMLSVFRYYNITPIFIFDGKPPTEKKTLLQKRKENKKEAEKEYNRLQTLLANEDSSLDTEDKQEIANNMDILKKQFVYINNETINLVKDLIRFHGMTYYDAHGEADELCALLVMKNKVWACLSEDMDMFVYGCPRVLRYISLMNHTVVLYDTKEILKMLGLTQKELREICVLSGTDYHSHIHKTQLIDNANANANENENEKNIEKSTEKSTEKSREKTTRLHKTLKLFKKYHNEQIKNNNNTNSNSNSNSNNNNNNNMQFYDWLLEKTNYIEDYNLLVKIYKMFDLNENHEHMKVFENIRIINGPIYQDKIDNILETDGFLFPDMKKMY